jgi:hypothetical protein
MDLMPSFRKMDRDRLADQVALLEGTTFASMLGDAVGELKDKATTALNWLARRTGVGKEIEKAPRETIEDRIANLGRELKALDEETLVSRLRTDLIKSLDLSASASDEAVSVALVYEASQNKQLKLRTTLSPGVLTEDFYNSFVGLLVDNLRIEDARLPFEERVRWDAATLANLTREENDKLREKLGVDQLTGDAIRRALFNTDGVRLTGSAVYIALSAMIDSLSTTIQGVSLPFGLNTGTTSVVAFAAAPFGLTLGGGIIPLMLRNGASKVRGLLLGILCLSASAFALDEAVTAPLDRVPGVLSVDQQAEEANLEKSLSAAETIRSRTRNTRDESRAQVEKLKRDADGKRDAVAKSEARVSDCESAVHEAKVAADTDRGTADPEAELQRAQVALSNASREAQDAERKLNEAREALTKAETELDSAESAELGVLQSITATFRDAFISGFPNLTISDSFLYSAARLSYEDRLKAAQCLHDLDSAVDPLGMERFSTNEGGTKLNYFDFHAMSGFCRIFFRTEDRRIRPASIRQNV